jgi:nicotinamide-nucleotide amidase
VARAARERGGSTYGLCVTGVYEGEPREKTGHVNSLLHFALAGEGQIVTRQTAFTGTRDWIAQGGTEMGLDMVRRHLKGLPVDEKIDFERAAAAKT